MNGKVGFFEEKDGVKSSMRLMSFLSLLGAIGMACLTLYTSNQDGIVLTFGFLLGAFAPKPGIVTGKHTRS